MTPRAIAINVLDWRAARRYGVPVPMVAEATRRRRAGDWRGACEAAAFDVQFDLGDVRHRHGAEVAGKVEDDLRHLAPDLVRWHLPRAAVSDHGPLQPNVALPLAVYDHAALWVRTPSHLAGPPRVEVHVSPTDRITPLRGRLADSGAQYRAGDWVDSWVDTRDLWDVRAAPGLRERVEGGDAALTDRVIALQAAGQLAEAWSLGGIPIDLTLKEERVARPENWSGSDGYALVPALAATVRRWWRDRHRSGDVSLVLRSYWTQPRSIVLTVDKRSVTAHIGQWPGTKELPSVPRSWWQRLPDLELLRLGEIQPAGLHPLVRASLLPDDEGDPEEYRPIATVDAAPVRVRCRGEWHRVGWRDGRITALNHAADETQRERVMSALGGEVPRCFHVVRSWSAGRIPSRPLRDLRRHGVLAMRHGDLAEVTRLLDLGVDPDGLRDDTGRGLLHYLAHLNSVPLTHRLLARGLDVNRRAGRGRTPLLWALYDRARGPIVEALLDAGADPRVVDDAGGTVLHLVRSADAAAYFHRLLPGAEDREAQDDRGCTPLQAQLLGDAATAVIRATWAIGADPKRRGPRGHRSASAMAVAFGRDDLDFLA